MIDWVRRQVQSALGRARPYAVRTVHIEHAALIVERASAEPSVVAAADRAGVETFFLEPGADPGQLARTALEAGDDALGVAGRDALLGPVADVAAHLGVPVFSAPVGPASHLARDLRLDVTDPTETLAAMARSEEILVDYCLANGRPFVNYLAVGRIAELAHEGVSGEDLILRAASDDGRRLRYATLEDSRSERTTLLVVSNNPMYLGGHPDFGRRMRLDRGLLGIAALGPLRGDVAAETPLRGCRTWSEWAVTQFVVESDAPILAIVDGVPVGFNPPLEIISRRKALAVVVPAGTRPGYLPSRRTGEVRLADLAGLIAPDA